MSHLSAPHISIIVTLVEPFCQTENERRALLDTLFVGATSRPEIDTSGAPLAFTRRLIFRLRDYGDIEPGKPALWALLETIRSRVGVDKQAQIDALRPIILDSAAPTADYVIVAEGGKAIFLSYSRRDAKLVERLRADLQAAGFNLWIDRKGLKVGMGNWQREIRKALTDADAVIYIGSPPAADSDYVGAEIAIAKEKQKPIFCVWAEGAVWSDSAPLSLVMAQYADLRGDAYAAGFAELVASLRGEETLTLEPIVPPTPEPIPPNFTPTNPYKGLQAFQAADRNRFFGRTAFVETLLAHLRAEPRFLAVIGASGSGKSSVVMAGLLPRLADGDAIPGSADWQVLEPFKPGKQPLESLTDQLGRNLPQLLPSDIRRELDHESARGLLRLARRITSMRLVLYIDQFEELFTLTEKDAERRQFIDLITTAANEPDSPVTILLTLRADFYDRPLAYAELGALVTRAAVPILPLTVTELFAAVREPAALASARLTFDEGLVEELVFAVNDEAGALPLLQFTLDLLFQRRAGLRLTWDAYNALGGVRGALANYAEATYQTLSEDGKRMARVLFLRLIEPGATEQDTTRRRAAQSELAYADTVQTALMQSVTTTFVDARLLTQDRSGDMETIEVSHEALIREWERLKLWLNESYNELHLQKKVNADAAEWVRAGQPPDYGGFYTGSLLLNALAWAERATPSADEQRFISTSVRNADRRRQFLRTMQLLIVLGLVIFTVLVFTLQNRIVQQTQESAATIQFQAETALSAAARAEAYGTAVTQYFFADHCAIRREIVGNASLYVYAPETVHVGETASITARVIFNVIYITPIPRSLTTVIPITGAPSISGVPSITPSSAQYAGDISPLVGGLVTPRMGFQLRGDPLIFRGLDEVGFDPDIRLISPSQTNEWRWLVEPINSAGTHALSLLMFDGAARATCQFLGVIPILIEVVD